MKTTKFSIILLFFIFNFISCGHSQNIVELKEADNIIETDPSASMSILSKINCTNLSIDEFAYYALLYTQAQIKCGIKVTSDTLIKFPYKYFDDDDRADLYIRSYFYNAKISYNREDLRSAMSDALIAYDFAKENNNRFWTAKSAELISDIFFDVYNYSQAEHYTKEAIANYSLSGKLINQRYAFCDLATIYLNENKDYEAIELLDSLQLTFVKEDSIDANLSSYLKHTIRTAYIKTGQIKNIEEYELDEPERDYSDDEKIDDFLSRSIILCSEGNFDESHDCISNANLLANSEQQDARILYASFLHAQSIGNYPLASTLADTLLQIQSNIAESILKDAITGVQRDFYSKKAQINKKRSELLSFVLIIVILVAIIITLLLLIIHRLRIKNKESELNSAMDALLYMEEQSNKYNSQVKKLSDKLTEDTNTISELKKELDDRQEIETQNIKIIETLFKEKWSTLNMLCNEYFERGESESTRISILHNIEEELNKLRSKKNLQQLERAVDNYLGGIMTCLREECRFLKEDDFTFLSLIFAGFSVRAVCLFTNIKYKLFYLKKSRLTKRILASDAPHKNIFLAKLS